MAKTQAVEFSTEQMARIEAAKKELGVKFLPRQAMLRAADPQNKLSLLGASKRNKLALIAKRAKLKG